MSKALNQHSIVSLAFCGVCYCKENISHYLDKAEKFLGSYKYHKADEGFPFQSLIVGLNLRCDSICFSLKVAPVSPYHDYAVVSGNAYSIFKVIAKSRTYFHVLWNNQTYSITMERNMDTFQVTLDHKIVVQLERIESPFQTDVLNFPTVENVLYEDLSTILTESLSDIDKVLKGFVLPEPFFSRTLYSQCERIFRILRDPLLPALELQAYLDKSSAKLCPALVSELYQTILQYTSNISSLFSRFPSQKIKSLIERYLIDIDDRDARFNAEVILRPIIELADMFSGGIRGHAKHILENILTEFLKLEMKFQNFDEVAIFGLVNTEINLGDMISHNVLPEKNKLILTVLEFLEKYMPGVIHDLMKIIQKLLSSLIGNNYSPVTAKLRKIMITGQIPSYEVRKNEMEAIFLNSVIGYSNCAQINRLENLICSKSEVFDIISDFFYHKMVDVRKCAMEVYVRRAYMVYGIYSFEQSRLSQGQLCVLFKFNLPSNNRQRSSTGYQIKRSNSFATFINEKSVLLRKSSQTNETKLVIADKEATFDEEVLNEEHLKSIHLTPKTLDYDDIDSAISVGTHSLSELSAVTSEQVHYTNVTDHQGRDNDRLSLSPLTQDKLCVNSINTFTQDMVYNVEISNDSANKLASSRHSRRASMFCNNAPPIYVHDVSGQKNLGIMIIFNDLNELEKSLLSIRDLILLHNSSKDDLDDYEYTLTSLDSTCIEVYNVVLKISLRDPKFVNKGDDHVSVSLLEFCDKYISFFDEIHVLRITFLLQSVDKSIRYFTFCYRGCFEEDIKLRNIDPILSFQLEINRLRNYYLERLPLPNRRMYVYMGTCKERTMAINAEYRIFVRCIIYHNDIHSATSNIEYLAKEAERNVIEALDSFDMVWIHERSKFTKANHTFFYFHSVLCISAIEDLEDVVRAIILRHGRRLWGLRITQAELKMSVQINNGPIIPIRLWIYNEGGKSLEICIYREEFQFKKDYKVLVSWSSGKQGRLHGVPVDYFYSN